MGRRPAEITQADAARVIRAAKQAGAPEVVMLVGKVAIVVRLTSSTDLSEPLAPRKKVVL
jgi:hypothetical protein